MRGIKWDISAGAVLLFALMYYFDDSGLFAVMTPAIVIHEMGHFLMLCVFGRRLRRVRVGLYGIEMDYAPGMEGGKEVLCAAAGPLFGALYAIAACTCGGEFFTRSGAASFLLTVFNLLPVLPLDGGHIVSALLPKRAARAISIITSVLYFSFCVWLLATYHAAAPLLIAAWLVFCNLKNGA